MSVNYTALKAELDLNHPTTGLPYDADAQLAADQMNELNRPVEVAANEILAYCFLETFRINTGTDTIPSNIYGRIGMVAIADIGGDPFDSTDTVNAAQIAAAITMLRLLDPNANFSLVLTDARFDAILTKLVQAGTMGAPDKAAILAFSEDKQSRTTEINFGRSKVQADHVTHAREIV